MSLGQNIVVVFLMPEVGREAENYTQVSLQKQALKVQFKVVLLEARV